jgi:hypothetical protein
LAVLEEPEPDPDALAPVAVDEVDVDEMKEV